MELRQAKATSRRAPGLQGKHTDAAPTWTGPPAPQEAAHAPGCQRTCRWGRGPGLPVRGALVLQAEPHMLAYPALQGNGSLERLPKQTQQPPQGVLERAPEGHRAGSVSRDPSPT